jgi:hypothetical protein
MAGIFAKVQLRPSQLRTVAERRFGDAKCLLESGKNERANGAMYLAGFVIECLLKARLVEKYPWLRNAGSHAGLQDWQQPIWSLCYRRHDLDEILVHLPQVQNRLSNLDQHGAHRLVESLKFVCAEWSIFARYSPQSATLAEANKFLGRVQELKECLR